MWTACLILLRVWMQDGSNPQKRWCNPGFGAPSNKSKQLNLWTNLDWHQGRWFWQIWPLETKLCCIFNHVAGEAFKNVEELNIWRKFCLICCGERCISAALCGLCIFMLWLCYINKNHGFIHAGCGEFKCYVRRPCLFMK